MVAELKAGGLRLDYDFSGGEEIINRITESLANDTRFLTGEEMLERCEESVPTQEYLEWYGGLPQKVREDLGGAA